MTDFLSPQQRSALMSRVRRANTQPERIIDGRLRALGLRPTRHSRRVPGKPDFAFCRLKVAIFVDGDFWHGWQFPRWREKLPEFWREKITRNRRRDRRNFRALRRTGWHVVRIRAHEIQTNPDGCIERIMNARKAALKSICKI